MAMVMVVAAAAAAAAAGAGVVVVEAAAERWVVGGGEDAVEVGLVPGHWHHRQGVALQGTIRCLDQSQWQSHLSYHHPPTLPRVGADGRSDGGLEVRARTLDYNCRRGGGGGGGGG